MNILSYEIFPYKMNFIVPSNEFYIIYLTQTPLPDSLEVSNFSLGRVFARINDSAEISFWGQIS